MMMMMMKQLIIDRLLHQIRWRFCFTRSINQSVKSISQTLVSYDDQVRKRLASLWSRKEN